MIEYVPFRIFHMEIHVIQERVLRRPQFHFLDRKDNACMVGACHSPFCHGLFPVFHHHFQGTVRFREEFWHYHQLALVYVRAHGYAFEPVPVYGFHPYSLPYPRHTGVEASFGVVSCGLFPHGLVSGAGIVLNADGEVVTLAGLHQAGDVYGK